MGHRLTVAEYFINQGYAVNKILKLCLLHKTTWYRFKSNNKNKIKKRGRPIPGYSYTKYGNKVSDSKIVSA